MTKGTYIDLIELAVNGGVLSDENVVKRAEIEAYLPVAVNTALASFRNAHLDAEGDRDMVNSMYQVYEDIAITDGEYWRSVTIPVKLLALPGQEAVRYFYTDAGYHIGPAPEGIEDYWDFYEKHMCDSSFFKIIGSKAKLYNVDEAITTINMVAIVDATSFTNSTELVIPAGYEDVLIKTCVDYFMAQRSNPADLKTDKRDLN